MFIRRPVALVSHVQLWASSPRPNSLRYRESATRSDFLAPQRGPAVAPASHSADLKRPSAATRTADPADSGGVADEGETRTQGSSPHVRIRRLAG